MNIFVLNINRIENIQYDFFYIFINLVKRFFILIVMLEYEKQYSMLNLKFEYIVFLFCILIYEEKSVVFKFILLKKLKVILCGFYSVYSDLLIKKILRFY